MNIIILYDSGELESERLVREAGEWAGESDTVRVFDAGKDPVKNCIGCFGCWTKTPGICVHKKDSGEEFLKAVINSDIFLRISRIVFGGYGSRIKNYTDRMIPLLHPYFIKVGGEMHHRARYKKYPRLMSVGWGAADRAEEGTFKRIFRANLRNFFNSENAEPLILKGDESGELAAWLERETGSMMMEAVK